MRSADLRGIALVIAMAACGGDQTAAPSEEPPPVPGAPVVAFVSTRDIGPGDGLDDTWIYLADAEGNVVSRLVRGGAPAWSPDGTRIAFHRWPGGRVADGDLEVAVINSDGTGIRVVATHAHMPSWSPDGSTIVYNTSEGNPEEGIYSVRIDDGLRRRLIAYASFPPDGGYGPGWVGFPAYSPDGTMISFVKSNFGVPWAVYLMRADGTDPREMLVGVGNARPGWSPDGLRLLVMLPQLFTSSLTWYVASTTLDGTLSNAYVQAPWIGYPEWSPDGRHILYSRFSTPPTPEHPLGTRARIYIHPVAGGVSRQFVPEASNPVTPDYWDTGAVWRRR